MKIKITKICFLITLMVILSMSALAVTYSIESPDGSIDHPIVKGQDFEVKVYAELNQEEIDKVSFTLQPSSNLVTIKSVNQGDLFDGKGTSTNQNTGSGWTYTETYNQGVSSAVVKKLVATFLVEPKQTGTESLRLTAITNEYQQKEVSFNPPLPEKEIKIFETANVNNPPPKASIQPIDVLLSKVKAIFTKNLCFDGVDEQGNAKKYYCDEDTKIKQLKAISESVSKFFNP